MHRDAKRARRIAARTLLRILPQRHLGATVRQPVAMEMRRLRRAREQHQQEAARRDGAHPEWMCATAADPVSALRQSSCFLPGPETRCVLPLLVEVAMRVRTAFGPLEPFRQHQRNNCRNHEEQQQADPFPLLSPGQAQPPKPFPAPPKPLNPPVRPSLIGQAILTSPGFSLPAGPRPCGGWSGPRGAAMHSSIGQMVICPERRSLESLSLAKAQGSGQTHTLFGSVSNAQASTECHTLGTQKVCRSQRRSGTAGPDNVKLRKWREAAGCKASAWQGCGTPG